MQSKKRAPLAAGLVWAMGLLAAVYVAALILREHAGSPVIVRWLSLILHHGLGPLALWVTVGVCWLAVHRGARRREVFLATAAVTSYAAGNTYQVAFGANTSVTSPLVGEVTYMLFNVLMLAALAVAARRHMRGLALAEWLDSVVGSFGAASVLAVLLRPVLDFALTGPLSMATVVAVAYPMLDVLLAAMITGISVLSGLRPGGRWTLLLAGLLFFAAANVVQALQVTAGTYAVGTPLDAGWVIGLTLVALWIDGAALDSRTPATQETRPVIGATALAVPAVATVAALGVLLVSNRTPVSTLAVALAGVALLAAAARTQVAVRQLRRMGDLHVQATTDQLTGLPNRRELYTRGAVLLAVHGQGRALLMLDLNKFKEVNDSLGHDVGDLLLVEVGTRLSEHLREGDLLARLGGDEFAVLLGDAGYVEAVEVAVKLRAALAEPFALKGITLHSHVSIGIALFPDDGTDLSTLLRKADIAMYKAKASSRGYHIYRDADDASDGLRLQTVQELRTALASDQFVLHYQPKIDLNTGLVHAVEALVRWKHPTRGLLYPDAFLDLVEESVLMPTLTRVVLALALDQAAAWQGQGRSLTVAVNLSANSLVDADLPGEIASMLAARGVPPAALQLEITEKFLMADRDRARNILTRLRESGVQISVDDFGAGFSSLSYLRDLPVDELKLDRSFILPMAGSALAAVLVASTIALAHSLGLRIVAEGVETDIAYAALKRMGCDQAQGFYVSRPVPTAHLDDWLRNRPAVEESAHIPPRVSSTALG